MPTPYDPQVSRIVAMSQALKDYRSDYDMIKAAEMHYERMRTLNNTTMLQVNLQKSAGNILGSLSIDSVWNNPKDKAIEAALAEARSGILSRAVGPFESLPVSDYIQDSTRAKNVATHTQFGAEHRLIAKLSQMRGNNWNPNNQAPGSAMSADTYVTLSDTGRILSRKEELLKLGTASSMEQSNAKHFVAREMTKEIVALVPKENGEDKILKNNWSLGTPYTKAEAQPVVDEYFNFSITNMAFTEPKKMFFPAHIRNFNEGISPQWNSVSLINRSEDIYIYQRAERTFNLEFAIFATNNDNDRNPYGLDHDSPFENYLQIGGEDVGVMSKIMMWERLEFLHSLTRPSYKSDGTYDKSPYCKLTLGGVYRDIYVIIDSVNINYEPLLWDLNPDGNFNQEEAIRPMIAEVTLAGKIIHNTSPSVTTKFYGVRNE